MMHPSPHFRNDETAYRVESARNPVADNAERISQDRTVKLPETEVSVEKISSAKKFLLSPINDISPLSVLKSIQSKSWCVSDMSDLAGHEAIKRFLQSHPDLLSTYNNLASQEGVFAQLASLIPIIGKPLPSTEYLDQFTAAGGLISEMEDLELIVVYHHGSTGLGAGGLFQPGMSEALITVSISGLGQHVLDSIQQEERLMA